MPELQRPALSRDLSGVELLRWYWRKDELTGFARSLGLRTTGSKETVAARVAAALDGVAFREPERTPNRASRHVGPLDGSTLMSPGQRCTRSVRDWFERQVGSSFVFDVEMRSFFRRADGTQTFQDALDHYRATRNAGRRDIDAQFEYNRFTRAWYESNPAGSREDCIQAWKAYRSQPVDRRGRV